MPNKKGSRAGPTLRAEGAVKADISISNRHLYNEGSYGQETQLQGQPLYTHGTAKEDGEEGGGNSHLLVTKHANDFIRWLPCLGLPPIQREAWQAKSLACVLPRFPVQCHGVQECSIAIEYYPFRSSRQMERVQRGILPHPRDPQSELSRLLFKYHPTFKHWAAHMYMHKSHPCVCANIMIFVYLWSRNGVRTAWTIFNQTIVKIGRFLFYLFDCLFYVRP